MPIPFRKASTSWPNYTQRPHILILLQSFTIWHCGGGGAQIFHSLQSTTQASTGDKVVLYKTKSLLLHSHEQDRQIIYKSTYTVILGSNRSYENKIRTNKRVKNDEAQSSRDDLAEETTLEQRPELIGQMTNVEVWGHFKNREQLVQRLCSSNVLRVCNKQQAGWCDWRKMSEGKNIDVVREDNKHAISHWLVLSKRI